MTTRFAALAAVTALVTVASAAPAWAIDQGKGLPGFCPGPTGVTVVVDFQRLGGITIVRCYPNADPGTGLDALKGAGFQIAGAARWGEGFVCRIENRPSAVETLPIAGHEDYREGCVNTPPATGYWSYWHASNGCAWTYSQWGVKNRQFVQGGFEGWSFSLNATTTSNPQPRVAPVRPGTAGQPCAEAAEPPPNSDNPAERQPEPAAAAPVPGATAQPGVRSDGGNAAPGQPGTNVPGTAVPDAPVQAGDAPGGALPPPRPRTASAAPDPAANIAFTGGEDRPDVNRVLEDQSGADGAAPWFAAGAVLMLAAATAYLGVRRRRAGER
ncbi:hypothetical protein [Actinokineospora enzanensis]|uniref:hypothetical protein n=1 Tax=Actinokineospora enzanensis TaxID=155975 RepID=UPI0003614634|nr:hypothetical protein [Actinokineospora enzanensis]